MTRVVVAIGWLYVVVLMAATQESWLAAIGNLVFYGLLPLVVVLYLLGAPVRARRRRVEAGRATVPPAPPAPAAADVPPAEDSASRDPD